MGRLTAVIAASAVAAAMLAPVAHADYSFNVCPSGVSGVATSVTSCAFADVVRQVWYADAPNNAVIVAYSPVTGGRYLMYCSASQVLTLNVGQRVGVRCDGGNDAVVVFW